MRAWRAMLPLVVCAAAACGDDEGGGTPPPAELEFRISVVETTMTGVKVSVEATNNTDTYYVSVDNKADFDARFATDEAYFAMKLDFIKVMAGVRNMSVADYLGTVLKRGEAPYEETDLYYDTEYYVCVFGLTADGEVTTPLTRYAVRTKTFEPSAECRFIIQQIETTATSIKIEVGASDPDVRYYVGALTEDEFAEYDSVDDAVADIIWSAELFDDIDWSKPNSTYAGRQTLTLAGLEPGTTYIVLAFGVDADGQQTTEAETARLTTAAE